MYVPVLNVVSDFFQVIYTYGLSNLEVKLFRLAIELINVIVSSFALMKQIVNFPRTKSKFSLIQKALFLEKFGIFLALPCEYRNTNTKPNITPFP